MQFRSKYTADSAKYTEGGKDFYAIAMDYTTVKVELYSDVLLAVAKPVPGVKTNTEDSDFFVLENDKRLFHDTASNSPGANFVIWGGPSDSWNISWVNLPTVTRQPNKAIVYIDDATLTVDIDGFADSSDGKTATTLTAVTSPIALREGNTNRFFDNINDAVAAASDNAVIEIRVPGTYVIENADKITKKLTIEAEVAKKADVIVKSDVPVANNDNLNLDGVTVDAPPPPPANPYGVPSTADNSNMPLWSVLFIAFAAVALLTGKKRRA